MTAIRSTTSVLVRGSGDVGSAVAHALHRAGSAVAVHDEPKPAHARRRMALVDALYDGVAILDGVRAKKARRPDDLSFMIACQQAVPVTDLPLPIVLGVLRPQVLVDARMRKRRQPESQIGLAELSIGLGPNFVAGVNSDLVIETAWGDRLGEVIVVGGASRLDGEPRAIAGHSRDRFVYAPASGTFRTSLDVGAMVERGEVVAALGEHVLRAPIAGRLRGLSHDGADVTTGQKVIEVDPRGSSGEIDGLGERPRTIAMGVLHAIKTLSV